MPHKNSNRGCGNHGCCFFLWDAGNFRRCRLLFLAVGAVGGVEVEVVEVVLDALFGRGDGHVVAIHAFEVGVVVLYALNGVPLKFKRAVDIGYRFRQNLAVAVGVACGEVALVVVVAGQYLADGALQAVHGEQFAHQSRHPARRAVAVAERVAVDEV